jgi:hypothetical protein
LGDGQDIGMAPWDNHATSVAASQPAGPARRRPAEARIRTTSNRMGRAARSQEVSIRAGARPGHSSIGSRLRQR